MRNLLFCIWIFILLAVIGSLKSKIWKAEDRVRETRAMPPWTEPTIFTPVKVIGAATAPESVYRGGPQRTGIYEDEIPYSMLRRTWRIDPFNHENHQASKSSPVLSGGQIFIGDDFGNMSSISVEGLRSWRHHSNADRGVHGSALVVDKTVFWGDYNGLFYAADQNSGELRWLIPLGDAIGSSPFYLQGYIYVSVETSIPVNGYVAKLDARDGKIIWLSPFLGEQAHSSPTLSADKRSVYVGANNGLLTALNIENGNIEWNFKTGGAIKGTAAVFGQDLYFCSWDASMYRLNPHGTLVWRSLLDGPCQSSPTFSKSSVFITTKTGKVQALHLENGVSKWSYPGEGSHLSSAIMVHDSKRKKEVLISVCETLKICIFEPESGKFLASIRTENAVTSVPLLFNRGLIISTVGKGGLGRWK